MIPEIYYLELHIAQVANEMSLINDKVKAGLYDNKKLIEYIHTLNSVLDEVIKCDLTTKTDNDKEQIRDILIFLSTCIQYIKSATINDMNVAIYVCLRAALEDWVKGNPLDYVMTTYKCDVGTHHYQPETVKGQTIKSILDVFNVVVPNKLVSLGYPSYLEKDFLSNVSLYHELGHFIDLSEWRISASLTNHIVDNKCLVDRDIYFKNIDTAILYDKAHTSHDNEWVKLFCMLREYFADVFSVQYIGSHKIHLSHYMFWDNDFDDSHPSTEARTKAIKNFLGPEASYDEFIKQIRWATEQITGRKLEVRNKSLSIDSLLIGQACQISEKHQLHTLFHNAWHIWETNPGGYKNNPDSISAYNKLNKLLEESIMNYENSR